MSFDAFRWAGNLKSLGHPERVVLMCLAHFRNSKTGACFPSLELMAKWCGVSVRSVSRGLANLRTRGLVKQLTRGGPGTSSSYELAMRTPANMAAVDEQHTPESTTTPAKKDRNSRHIGSVTSNNQVLTRESKALLRNFKIRSPEVRARIKDLRPDIDPEVFITKYIDKNGAGTDAANERRFWRWVENEHAAGGRSPADKRREGLLELVATGILRVTQREGESENAYLARIEAVNERRIRKQFGPRTSGA